MLSRGISFFVAGLLFGASFLGAQQSPPSVYLGPYLQPSAAQFAGEWTRSDGTYQLNVVEEKGTLKVEYLNPKSIHVESAALRETDEGLIMQVILRDEGYPGSIYELEYLPQYRVLVGTYTIPGQGPSEVFFTK